MGVPERGRQAKLKHLVNPVGSCLDLQSSGRINITLDPLFVFRTRRGATGTLLHTPVAPHSSAEMAPSTRSSVRCLPPEFPLRGCRGAVPGLVAVLSAPSPVSSAQEENTRPCLCPQGTARLACEFQQPRLCPVPTQKPGPRFWVPWGLCFGRGVKT